MQIRNQVQTLTLAAMLAFSVMSPLAAHVSAAPNDGGGSGSGSASVTCGTMNGDKDVYTGAQYKDGGTVSQGTEVNRKGESKVQICSSDGTWHDLGRMVQPSSHLPVPQSAGSALLP